MRHLNQSKTMHPISFAIKNIIDKLFQQPGVYPIKFYKKAARLRKKRGSLSGF